MLKRFIGLTLCLALLFTMTIPVFAAQDVTEPTETNTVEDILNKYHERAFRQEIAEETGSASGQSRSGGAPSKTLEEETVEELLAEGYEAYHVTADNYDTLEETLQTNFPALGLDANGSYIVVIGGVRDSEISNPVPASDTLLPPHIGDDEGGEHENVFVYQYNGITYRMRYVTITNADMSNNELYSTSYLALSNIDYLPEIWEHIANFSVSFIAEKIVKKSLESGGSTLISMVPYAGVICSFVSLLGNVGETVIQDPVQYLDPDDWSMRASTSWTQSFIEIYDSNSNQWYAVQRSTHANMRSEFYGPTVYDPELNQPISLGYYVQTSVVYSTYYNNSTTRKQQAVLAYLGDYIHLDSIDYIDYYFSNPSDPNARDVLIVTHESPG